MKNKKFSKEELFKMDPVEVYKLVLERKHIKKFPDGFWQRPESIDNSIACIKWLVEESFKLTDDELRERLSKKLFCDNGLAGMLNTCFKGSPFNAINTAYPDKFKEWEFNVVPKDFWNREKGIETTKWLVSEKLKLTDKELKEQLSKKLFYDNGLTKMLIGCFNSSPFEAINTAYPDKFKEWEFNSVPKSFWTKEKGIEATKWLVSEKLKLSDKELKEQLSQKLFNDNGLYSMIRLCFNGSPFEAINAAYPGKFKEWEFNIVPNGFWTKENGVEATKWLVSEELKLTDEELKERLSQKLFYDNGLYHMLRTCFNGSPFEAINATYPNKFKEWEFQQVPNGFWTKEKGVEAIKWLVSEKLKLTDKELKKLLSTKLFIDNGLGGMLQQCFNNRPYSAINSAYPNKFKKEDFKNITKSYFS